LALDKWVLDTVITTTTHGLFDPFEQRERDKLLIGRRIHPNPISTFKTPGKEKNTITFSK
jgi:hypothetical protein